MLYVSNDLAEYTYAPRQIGALIRQRCSIYLAQMVCNL